MRYYIWGLQRSGTNYLDTLIKQNFSIRGLEQRDSCWKHSINIPKEYDPNNISFVIYKNPYTWIESLIYRHSVDFLRRQKTYPTLSGNGIYHRGYNITNMCLTYLHFFETWIDKEIPNRFIVRYEDLLNKKYRSQILSDVHEQFGLKRSRSEWFNPPAGRVRQSSDYNDQRREYYLSGVPEKLDEAAIAEINRVLPEPFLNVLGYSKVNSNLNTTHGIGE